MKGSEVAMVIYRATKFPLEGHHRKVTVLHFSTETRIQIGSQMRTTRDKVKPGAIFAIDQGAGRSGNKRYGAIGTNGKYASINMRTGKLAFTPLRRADKRVVTVGHYNIDAIFLPPSQHRKVARRNVSDSALFIIAEGNNVYAHLGKNNDDKVVSLNLRSRDYAVGTGNGSVTVVGSYKMKGQAV